MEVINSFKYLGSCFGSEGGVEENISMRAGEGTRAFGSIKRVWRGRNVTLAVKRELKREPRLIEIRINNWLLIFACFFGVFGFFITGFLSRAVPSKIFRC